jgi:hypothetical protein
VQPQVVLGDGLACGVPTDNVVLREDLLVLLDAQFKEDLV